MNREKLARKLHEWYREAIANLDPANYNANSDKEYEALNDEQRSIDRFLAGKIADYFENEED